MDDHRVVAPVSGPGPRRKGPDCRRRARSASGDSPAISASALASKLKLKPVPFDPADVRFRITPGHGVTTLRRSPPDRRRGADRGLDRGGGN